MVVGKTSSSKCDAEGNKSTGHSVLKRGNCEHCVGAVQVQCRIREKGEELGSDYEITRYLSSNTTSRKNTLLNLC